MDLWRNGRRTRLKSDGIRVRIPGDPPPLSLRSGFLPSSRGITPARLPPGSGDRLPRSRFKAVYMGAKVQPVRLRQPPQMRCSAAVESAKSPQREEDANEEVAPVNHLHRGANQYMKGCDNPPSIVVQPHRGARSTMHTTTAKFPSPRRATGAHAGVAQMARAAAL